MPLNCKINKKVRELEPFSSSLRKNKKKQKFLGLDSIMVQNLKFYF